MRLREGFGNSCLNCSWDANADFGPGNGLVRERKKKVVERFEQLLFGVDLGCKVVLYLVGCSFYPTLGVVEPG